MTLFIKCISFRLLTLGLLMVTLPGCIGSREKFSQESALDFNLSLLEGKQNLYPVVIIGSGPAGLSAAVYAGRGKAKTLVLLGHKPGGLLTETSYVENWPAIQSMLGKDIMDKMMSQASHFGAEFDENDVETIDLSSWPYVVTTDDGKKIYAMTIIIATGASPRLLAIPGEKEYWGRGVTTCAVCDAPFYKDKEVVVIGGGDSAVEEAIQLAQYAKKITILVRKDRMRAAPTMQELLKGYPHISVQYQVEPKEIKGNDTHVTAITLVNAQDKSTADMPIDGVFLAIGHIPNTKLIKDRVSVDEQGYIVLQGRTQQTSLKGVYAAGDVEDHRYRQAGVAAGHGIGAALDALAFLNEIGFNTEIAAKMGLQPPVQKVAEVSTLAELQSVLATLPVAVLDCRMSSGPSSLTLDGSLRQEIQIVKVNIEKSKDIAKKFYIFEAPAVLVFQKGTLIGRFNHAIGTAEIATVLNSMQDKEPLVMA